MGLYYYHRCEKCGSFYLFEKSFTVNDVIIYDQFLRDHYFKCGNKLYITNGDDIDFTDKYDESIDSVYTRIGD